MTPDFILFLILAFVAVVSAMGLLLSKNAIYAALYLVLNFITVAIFYLMLGAPFIAMIQITVYAGAIMVLFLFVIMLLGAERLAGRSALVWQRPLAIFLALVLLAETGYLLFSRGVVWAEVVTLPAQFGSPAEVGALLFNKYLIPFEVTSVLLLVAMIGAVVLTKREKGKSE
ncbi:MAG: NADH-quinone oxidoreductase subunit J [Chloroflexota bacterium]